MYLYKIYTKMTTNDLEVSSHILIILSVVAALKVQYVLMEALALLL